jgi:hypothetical protein
MGADPLTALRLHGPEQLIDPHLPLVCHPSWALPPWQLHPTTVAAHLQGAQSPPRQFNLPLLCALREIASSASLAWIASKPAVLTIATALRDRRNLFLCRWHTPQTRLQFGAINKSRVALCRSRKDFSMSPDSDTPRNHTIGLQRISEALIASGYTSFDEQAKALGINRSTALTIIKTRHKLGRLSTKTTKRILSNPNIPPPRSCRCSSIPGRQTRCVTTRFKTTNAIHPP